ncbi:hypothetical protein LCGC14_1283020 [marine sediment metagenome]|uniref:Uncharacterized protein n=1 Tax=marine sediment metagenome TaxID=412755 RepID=A0A0F9KWE1_9ZZZZ
MKTNYIHKCVCKVPHAIYGPAIDVCIEEENGKYWVDNDEYSSQVNYCPFCGSKAPTQIAEKEFIIQEIREDLCI